MTINIYLLRSLQRLQQFAAANFSVTSMTFAKLVSGFCTAYMTGINQINIFYDNLKEEYWVSVIL